MRERVRTRGIVLKKLDYSDSSVIVTLFTYYLGRVKVLVRGAKRPKSRFVSIFETFNIVETVVHVKENREIQHISDARTLTSYAQLRHSYQKQVWASRITRFVDSILPDLSPSKGLYSLTERTLFMLSNSANEDAIFVAFVSKALRVLGYGLDLDGCKKCGNDNISFLSPSRGGGVCSRCAKTEDFVIYLNKGEGELLRNLYTSSLSVASRLPVTGLADTILRYAEAVTHVDGLYEKVMVRKSAKK